MKKHLSQQLVLRIILFSTLFATVNTAIQLYFDFRLDSDTIRSNVHQISTIHTLPLSKALWTYNAPLAQVQLDALQELQGINYLEIVDSGIPGLQASGNLSESSDISEVPLIYNSEGESITLGMLIIGASYDRVYQRLLEKFLLVFATNSVKVFLVAGFIILLIQKLVTRPIDHLVEHIHTIGFQERKTTQTTIPELSNDSAEEVYEITEIKNAIINLERDLQKSYTSLIKAKDELELRVEERTRKLDEAKQEAERLARIDPLTGLYNRRAFYDYAHRIDSQARRADNHYGVLMIDIDQFKHINDTHGHEAGDQVLKNLATVFNNHVRESDVVGRLGGEEFALVLPSTTIEGALDFAHR